LTKEEKVKELIDAGADGVVKKPFKFDELANSIDKALKHSGQKA
jgi:DNA-binding response OmpR family regulator